MNKIFIEKALKKLSKANYIPKSPKYNIEMEVLDQGAFWDDLGNYKGWKLQKNKLFSNYRIINPEKRRIAYGTEDEIGVYLEKILKSKNKEEHYMIKIPSYIINKLLGFLIKK